MPSIERRPACGIGNESVCESDVTPFDGESWDVGVMLSIGRESPASSAHHPVMNEARASTVQESHTADKTRLGKV